MTWRTKLRAWRQLRHDDRGVAALEFALVIPLVVIVYAAGFEITQGATVNRKLTDTTVQLANVTSQYTSMQKADVTAVMGASAQIMAPYATSPLTVVLTEVQTDKNSAATVTWSEPWGTGAVALAKGSSVTMPTNLASPNSYYILAQTTYSYAPTIGAAFVSSIPMKDQIFMVPRQSTSIPCSDC